MLCNHAQGLSYLLTFLFAANTVGLTGLAIQLVLFPDMELDGPKPQPRPGADLPKVRITFERALCLDPSFRPNVHMVFVDTVSEIRGTSSYSPHTC